MDFGTLGGGAELRAYEQQRQMQDVAYNKMPSLRERLERRLAQKREEIANLEAALAALNPDIEKAFDALARVGNF